MNAQQSSWLVSFGLAKPPAINIAQKNIERRGSCVIVDRYKSTKQLKKDIREKIEQRIYGRINIYNALLAEDKIPERDGKIMNIKAFGDHLLSVTDDIEKNEKFSLRDKVLPKGEKVKNILDYFDNGISEQEIRKMDGLNPSHVYLTLVKYGRIQKRDHATSLKHGAVQIVKINELLKTCDDIHQIAEKTGSSIKYVQQLRLARKRAIFLFEQEKSVEEICMSVKISKVHAEYIEKELNNGIA